MMKPVVAFLACLICIQIFACCNKTTEVKNQIKGQPRQTIRKADAVKCPPNILHWHGASRDTGMQQLYILPKTEKGPVTWLQPVTDKEYNNATKK